KISAADSRLDGIVTGFGEIIRGALHHFNPHVADAALSLQNLFKTYGNIARKNYDEELAAVTNLLQDLEGAYADRVMLITGLSEWVKELGTASRELADLLALRNTETAEKPQVRMVNVRREIDPVYRNFVARIEALSLIEGESDYIAFINELNALVERFNHIRPHQRPADGENSKPSN
ncbi:MAG: DUF6261 family protein, partial [Tannerella sp.]|nr:DUF6261 family protein [Tannerella sp.]